MDLWLRVDAHAVVAGASQHGEHTLPPSPDCLHQEEVSGLRPATSPPLTVPLLPALDSPSQADAPRVSLGEDRGTGRDVGSQIQSHTTRRSLGLGLGPGAAAVTANLETLPRPRPGRPNKEHQGK
ncbi:hypothetical protein E2C01_004824 [Portunus trituberculatus]|uniref:Uncharacterized protein n=1 Tax=Portunus trituberculatus TaxID=210409 RepID=A0A5B7CUZ3_PORTR|nr:hypothetical protein [Portunus trituberculatus]